jgi:TonB family protein
MGRFTRALPLLALALPSVLIAAVSPPAHANEYHRPLVSRTMPVYPELARRMRIYGEVVVHADILPNGTVQDVHALSGHALLRGAAEDAVRHWRFAPAPGPGAATVSVEFNEP